MGAVRLEGPFLAFLLARCSTCWSQDAFQPSRPRSSTLMLCWMTCTAAQLSRRLWGHRTHGLQLRPGEGLKHAGARQGAGLTGGKLECAAATVAALLTRCRSRCRQALEPAGSALGPASAASVAAGCARWHSSCSCAGAAACWGPHKFRAEQLRIASSQMTPPSKDMSDTKVLMASAHVAF